MSALKSRLPGRKRRPNLSRAVRLVIRDVARRVPELSHVRAEQVLVVAGEARRKSRATIRPLRYPGGLRRSPDGRREKPRVTFRDRRILYVLTLRPLFFRSAGAAERVETIIHELFHTSSRFDGTLDSSRRHSALSGAAFEHALRPLVKRYLADCPADTLERLSQHGEVLVRQWLEKPPASFGEGKRVRRSYDESCTFLGPVEMITPARH